MPSVRNSVVYANELRLRNAACVTRLSCRKVRNGNFVEPKLARALVKFDETFRTSSLASYFSYHPMENRNYLDCLAIYNDNNAARIAHIICLINFAIYTVLSLILVVTKVLFWGNIIAKFSFEDTRALHSEKIIQTSFYLTTLITYNIQHRSALP